MGEAKVPKAWRLAFRDILDLTRPEPVDTPFLVNHGNVLAHYFRRLDLVMLNNGDVALHEVLFDNTWFTHRIVDIGALVLSESPMRLEVHQGPSYVMAARLMEIGERYIAEVKPKPKIEEYELK